MKPPPLEAAEKKKRVHESGVSIAKVNFSEPTSTASEVEQHSEGLASVALELNDVYELICSAEMFSCT